MACRWFYGDRKNASEISVLTCFSFPTTVLLSRQGAVAASHPFPLICKLIYQVACKRNAPCVHGKVTHQPYKFALKKRPDIHAVRAFFTGPLKQLRTRCTGIIFTPVTGRFWLCGSGGGIRGHVEPFPRLSKGSDLLHRGKGNFPVALCK